MKSKKETQPFVAVNDRDKLIRDISYNPVFYPNGRNWMRISKFLMGRTTKIGKTQINMSIKTGERIIVGNKTRAVQVSLTNPNADQLANCELDEGLKIAAEVERAKIMEAVLKS